MSHGRIHGMFHGLTDDMATALWREALGVPWHEECLVSGVIERPVVGPMTRQPCHGQSNWTSHRIKNDPCAESWDGPRSDSRPWKRPTGRLVGYLMAQGTSHRQRHETSNVMGNVPRTDPFDVSWHEIVPWQELWKVSWSNPCHASVIWAES